jgi:hypothetical protein
MPVTLRVEGMPPKSAMINVFHLASAAPIAMFGMFALWAVASKRIGSSALRLWPRPCWPRS